MIRDIVLEAIKAVNHELDKEFLNHLEDSTLLFENLDSFAILDLILEIEDRLHSSYRKYIEIADETVMDEIKTPFKTVGSLIIYLENKITNA